MSHKEGGDDVVDDQDGGISRRTVLSSLALAGGGGAVGGSVLGMTFDGSGSAGPTAKSLDNSLTPPSFGGFWDREISGNFSANILTAGELDLTACWEQPGEDCTPTSTESSLALPQITFEDSYRTTLRCGLDGNPGWLWLRTSCPDDACGLERGINLTVWYDEGCDGTVDETQILTARDGTPIDSLRLCDALSKLHEGVLLDADRSTATPDPLEPNETCCIGFEFEADEEFCLDEEDDLTVEVDLFAEQRRHNPEPLRPPAWVDDPCTVDCNDECPPCDFQGISFIAFGITEGSIDPGDISMVPHYDIEGEPYKVDWQSKVDIEWVVLFYGEGSGKGKSKTRQCFENFHVDGDTSGSVHVNAQEHTPGDADFDSKLCVEKANAVTAYGQCPRDPCPDISGLDYGCGVKYNFDDDVWDGVCKQVCKSENGGGP